MTQSNIIIVLVLVVIVAIVVSIYLHKKHIHYNEADLQRAITTFFDKTGEDVAREKDVFRMIQKRYNCSRKDTLYLMGIARKKGFIEQDGEKVRRGVSRNLMGIGI